MVWSLVDKHALWLYFFKSILEQNNAWKQVQMFSGDWSLRINFMPFYAWFLFAYSLKLRVLFYSVICNHHESMPRPERLLHQFRKPELDQTLKESLLTQCRLFRIWKDRLWKEIPQNLAIYPCGPFSLWHQVFILVTLVSLVTCQLKLENIISYLWSDSVFILIFSRLQDNASIKIYSDLTECRHTALCIHYRH